MELLSLGSRGPNVKLVQSLLNRIGYNAGPVDGIFGVLTQQAVIQFQRNNALKADGIVGPRTWAVFDRLLTGYDTYTIRPSDSLYKIARMYYTTVNAILIANPGINPNMLLPGQRIIVPYGFDIVFNDIDYTYEIIDRQIRGLKIRYPFLEVGSIGRSVMGKILYYIRLGRGNREVFYNGAHHANEWITTPLLMQFIENYAKAYSVGGSIKGYNIPQLYNSSSIYIVPMVNPDGVDLVNYWPNYTNPVYRQAALLNNTGLPLPRVWKANIRGVDLNVNYPASWEKEKQLELEEGITGPAPRDYGGERPLSEPETIAVVNFTRTHNFRLVIAYHTQGEVIYWQFENLAPPVSLTIGNIFSRISGYALVGGPGEAAYAGYKDWFIQEYGRPGYTIEVGRGVNPLPVSQLPGIYRENEEILLLSPLL
jgi:g-D-glutamyl-meso-diaminopimelate peptidase